MAETRHDHAIVRELPRIFLTCRGLGRYLQAFGPGGPARGGRHRAALGACLTADVTLWWAMRRGRAPLPARIAINASELAYWCAVSPTGLQGSLASHIAEDIEAGFRWGVAGFGAPLLDTAVSSAIRTVTHGSREVPISLAFTAAVFGGVAVRKAEERRLGRAREEHAAELSARRGRAFLAGQNSIGMGASSVVDLLSSVASLLGSADAGTALYQVRAGWKASLAEQTRSHAIYLDQALRVWEQLHNQHPDLMSDVEVMVPEGVGTTLLSGAQAVALGRLLDERNLRGRVEVDLAAHWLAQDRRPGRVVELLVNGLPLEIPADPAAPLDEFNAAPPTFLFAAAMAISQIRESAADVPVGWAALPALVDLGAAWYLADRPPRQAAGEQLAFGLATAVLQGYVFAKTARRREPGEAVLFPGTYGIAPVLLLMSANWHRLPPRSRAIGVATLGILSLAAYGMAESPKALTDLLSELAWPLAAFIGSTGVTRATEEEAARLLVELDTASDEVEGDAFQEGRASVLTLVTAAVGEAESAFLAQSDIDPDVSEAISSRLKEIRDLLEMLEV